MQFDVNINATLEVDDEDWKDLVNAYDGEEDEALQELAYDLESSAMDSIYGSVWACSVEVEAM